MFNSLILDVTIGLVFIFLLYSLLATSINEAIATLLGLRARMLKNAIVERMLANNKVDNIWKSVLIGFKEFFLEFLKLFIGKREKKEEDKKIGDKFFEHPLIKNYGSSKIYPTPSYLPASNFSTVLIDLLKQEFDNKINEIADYKYSISNGNESLSLIALNLAHSSDIIKIKELIDYYSRHYSNSESPPPFSLIDKETWQILRLHLQDSAYNFDKFVLKIEAWFDDSMNRVTGWYKRQTQIILFFLGIFLAIIFNVDTIKITNKLSTDNVAREKLLEMSIQAADKYKDDPRVRKIAGKNGEFMSDTSKDGVVNNDSIFKKYQRQIDSIVRFRQNELTSANNIIGLGWGDYGMRRDSAKIMKAYFDGCHCQSQANIPADSLLKRNRIVLDSLFQKHSLKYKLGYVLDQSFEFKTFLGFLLTALAISLGAPFWFDLLNKLVKLRAAGKKEESSSDPSSNKTITQPVTLNVNTQTGEEAVG